jgi:tryptophan synthase alpha chain
VNRIDKRFKDIKEKKGKAFIAYICAGDPDISTTERLVLEFDRIGVDIVELGIPFSDPLADGPTIQKASQRALKGGVTLGKIFSLISLLRKKTDIPIVLMGYYNPVYNYGIVRFIKEAKASGADGIIIPDLIPEEADELIFVARQCDFKTIFLAAPTSTKKRMKLIAQKSTGFIYYVSLAGVTGARAVLPTHIREHIRTIKRLSSKPVCVGFGVSTPEQVKRLSLYCDGVIVGSAIINRIEKSLPDRPKAIRDAAIFVKNMVQGVR